MDKTYPAFITTGVVDQSRTPLSGERIVVVLGTDEQTGLPLELSISLRREPDNSIFIYAIKEPIGQPGPLFPRLAAENVCTNLKKLRIAYASK